MYKYYVKGYTSDFEEMDSFRYGLAHDANETYYFKYILFVFIINTIVSQWETLALVRSRKRLIFRN